MGTCCSKREETLVEKLRKRAQEKKENVMIVANNENDTYERIKINKQRTENLVGEDGESKKFKFFIIAF